jgi:phage gp16-like protein
MHTNAIAHKKRLTTLINIAKSQLQLDEDIYRLMLKTATTKDSLRAMNLSELEQALEAFKQKGFKPTHVKPRLNANKRLSPKSGQAHVAQIDKIRAVWINMGNHNVVQDNSETALDNYARRMTARAQKVDSVSWLNETQAVKVLESLKNWHRRELLERIQQRSGAHNSTLSYRMLGYNQVVDLYLNGAYGGAAHE